MLEGFVPWPEEFKQRYYARGYWEGRSMAAVFAEACARHGDRIAVVAGDERITYRQLDERATRLALHLWQLGIRPLQTVVVQLPNVPEFLYLYFALQKIGATGLMALPPHRYHEISYFVQLTEATGYAVPERLGDDDLTALAARLQAEYPSLRHVLVHGRARQPGHHSLQELLHTEPGVPEAVLREVTIDPEDPAVFLLSGGTTGIPKIIPRTHNDYVYNSRAAGAVNDIRPDDALLVVLPIAHNFPLASPGVQAFLLAGARVVLSTSTRAADALPLIARERVTHLELVPALLVRWINDPLLREHDLSSVRIINTGGQKLQEEVKRRTEALLPHAKVQEVLGMAEGLLNFVRLDDPDEVRYTTVGRPVSPDDEIRIVDDDGADVPPGEIGELWTRGPYTLRGYFRAPEHNARAFTPDGFYKTGDLVRLHPSGNLIVEGRKKDLINRGGEKISAEEVENLILQHEAVLNVACVPMPDPVLGERMCAYVIPRGARAAEATLTLEDLTRFLMERGLAKFKLPERLELVDEFPMSAFGKVSKKDLAARIAAQVAAERAAAQGAQASAP
jgi:2,3-dihydroxybenzoate-AMP ligase